MRAPSASGRRNRPRRYDERPAELPRIRDRACPGGPRRRHARQRRPARRARPSGRRRRRGRHSGHAPRGRHEPRRRSTTRPSTRSSRHGRSGVVRLDDRTAASRARDPQARARRRPADPRAGGRRLAARGRRPADRDRRRSDRSATSSCATSSCSRRPRASRSRSTTSTNGIARVTDLAASSEQVFVLLRSPVVALQLRKAGVPFDVLNVGGIGVGPGSPAAVPEHLGQRGGARRDARAGGDGHTRRVADRRRRPADRVRLGRQERTRRAGSMSRRRLAR